MESSATWARPGIACWALLLLVFANALSVSDRLLLALVTEPVRADLHLSDRDIALANGLVFVVFHLIGGFVLARLVDRGSRKRVLVFGIAGWSIATATTAGASDLATLSLARVGVGLGEAAAFPAAMSLIPDLFRPEVRGRAIAIFQTSGFVGVMGGASLAGVVAEHYGWRPMFLFFGAAGLLFAVIVSISLMEPAPVSRPATVPGAWLSPREVVRSCRHVLRVPGFPALVSAFGLAAVTASVLGAWGPALLQRVLGASLDEAGFVLGPAFGLGGIAGTLLAGSMADWLASKSRNPSEMLRLPIFALLLALPCAVGFAFSSSLGWATFWIATCSVVLGCAVAPCVTCAVARAPPAERGMASILMLTAAGVVGAGFGPYLAGAISDAWSMQLGAASLRYAIAVTALSSAAAAGLLAISIASSGSGHPAHELGDGDDRPPRAA